MNKKYSLAVLPAVLMALALAAQAPSIARAQSANITTLEDQLYQKGLKVGIDLQQINELEGQFALTARQAVKAIFQAYGANPPPAAARAAMRTQLAQLKAQLQPQIAALQTQAHNDEVALNAVGLQLVQAELSKQQLTAMAKSLESKLGISSKMPAGSVALWAWGPLNNIILLAEQGQSPPPPCGSDWMGTGCNGTASRP